MDLIVEPLSAEARPARPARDLVAEELQTTSAAILEVVRRLTLTSKNRRQDDDRLPPVRLPALDPRTRAGGLARLALLDAAGTFVLRALLAAERNRHVFAGLHQLASDVRGTGIAVQAVVAVAEAVGHAERGVLAALSPTAPLLRQGLVEATPSEGTSLARKLSVPDRVLQVLVDGSDRPPADLPLTREPARPAADLHVASQPGAELGTVELLRHLLAEVDRRPVWITGAPASGRKTLVAAVAAEQGLATLCLDHRLVRKRKPDELLPILWREVLLGQALVILHDVETTDEGVPAPQLLTALARAGLPVVFVSDEPPALGDYDRPPSLLELPAIDEQARATLWRAALPGCAQSETLASRFRLAPGRILRVAAAAHETAGLVRRAVVLDDVVTAVSRSVGQRVARLGTRIVDAQTWDDVVLPAETLDAVREMVSRVRFRHRVLDEWGFQKKVAKGTGVVSLFSGPPGTGKTMVAGLIAGELGLELYQIDLSRIVSKYIGETEKNLAQVFDAAEGANVMLLFDEADSLFAKRSEVKSSNDRHSNAEVNYLLQRVERFEGMCVLTTNLEGSIDPAFRRRLAFRIHFPMPEAAERARLWRGLMPAKAEIAPDLKLDKLDKLAKSYELSGGRIRNAVLRAAFLAASEGSPITMQHLERSVALEYRDAGNLSSAGRLA